MRKLKQVKQLPTVLVLITSLLISACQSMGGQNNPNVDGRLTNNQQNSFFSDSGLKACAVGAGVGGIGCLLINHKKPLVCAATAVAGCAILMGGNYYLDQQRATYANKEERLNAYIKDLREQTNSVKEMNRTATKVLNDDKKTLADLNKKIKANTISKDEAKAELAKVDANLNYLNGKLAKMKDTQASWNTVASAERSSGMKMSKLDADIKEYNRQVKALEQHVATVASQRSAIKVG